MKSPEREKPVAEPNAEPSQSPENYRNLFDQIYPSGIEQPPTAPVPTDTKYDSSSDDDEDDSEEDEEDEKKDEDDSEEEEDNDRKKNGKVGWQWQTIVEWVAFSLIMACLVTNLTVHPWKEIKRVWGLELPLWKWYLMVLVVVCGHLVSGWLVGLLTFLIKLSYNFRKKNNFQKKVRYLGHSLRKSVQKFFWLGLVILSWYIMFDQEVENKTRKHRSLKRVWRGLIAFSVGTAIWSVKIILVKMLASSFHEEAFFNRMQENVLHHNILEKLSNNSTKPQQPSQSYCGENAYALSVNWLEKHVMTSSGHPSFSKTIDQTMEEFKESESAATIEKKARKNGSKIFKNVAKDGKKIEVDDDLKKLEDKEIKTILSLFGGKKTKKIKKSDFMNWVVRVYLERRALSHSLNDTKTGVHQLHKLASAVVIVIIIVESLLVMGVATTKVVFVVMSQLLLSVFIFGNTCKNIFESIIFAFVMHPFDVGDRCIIDSAQVVVEEMNILTTVFLRFDQEKVSYPNSVLLTKPISNFRRSPDMGDCIEFGIDVSTPIQTFSKMKDEIKKYIKNKPKYWKSKHSVIVKEIENVNKMKIALYVVHTMNHQDFSEKNKRRSRLVLKLKRIFEDLRIEYHLLPQQVHLS